MKIHEYQAKEFLKLYNVAVPKGFLAFSAQEAKDRAQEFETFPVVVKAQIHAGGRGKAGGVKIANSKEDVFRIANEIIGMNLVTNQTGKEGKIVKKVLIEEGLDIKKELYLSFIPDRETAKIAIIASEAGGMDIEEVALHNPEKVIKVFIDPLIGIQPFHYRQIGFGLNLSPTVIRELNHILRNLYYLFIDYDCSLIEINPLIITSKDLIVALDAKINFDDNAIFRHKDLLDYRDIDEEEPLEVEASKFNLNYIKMDGNIGNMVNGAGLAMATMDIIKLSGAKPANFLDVGGGASAEMVENGFRIILSDTNVKAIFINIFGGILRCDILANGVVQAAKKIGIKVPVIIRMEGTNVEQARNILSESKLNLISAIDLKDAVYKISQINKTF